MEDRIRPEHDGEEGGPSPTVAHEHRPTVSRRQQEHEQAGRRQCKDDSGQKRIVPRQHERVQERERGNFRRPVRPQHHDAGKILAGLAAERIEVVGEPAARNDQRNRPGRDAGRGCRQRPEANAHRRSRAMGRAERSPGAAPSTRRSAIGSRSPDRRGIAPASSARVGGSRADEEPAGSARAIKTRAATATHSPDTSLNGRSEVNQNRGDAAAITAASAGRNGCGSSVRHNVKTSSRSPAPASALHTARPRTSGDATPAARSSGVETLPSAMNSGIAGRMRLMLRDVEVADAQREVDRVDVFERAEGARPDGRAGTAPRAPAGLCARGGLRSGAVAAPRSGCRGGSPADRA